MSTTAVESTRVCVCVLPFYITSATTSLPLRRDVSSPEDRHLSQEASTVPTQNTDTHPVWRRARLPGAFSCSRATTQGSHDPHRCLGQLPQASPATSSRRSRPQAVGDRHAAPRRHAGPSQRGQRLRKQPSAIRAYTADTYHTCCHLSGSPVDAHLSPTAAATPLIGAAPPHHDHRRMMIRRCSPRTLRRNEAAIPGRRVATRRCTPHVHCT